MIKKNQELLNRLNTISDGLLIVAALYMAFFIRFYWFTDGIQNIPLKVYGYAAIAIACSQIIMYALLGVYQPQRKRRLRRLCIHIFLANVLGLAVLQAALYFLKIEDFSRFTLFLFFLLETFAVCAKHIVVRLLLRDMRKRGFNQKYIVMVGSGKLAASCCNELANNPELGSQVIGYLSESQRLKSIPWLGSTGEAFEILEKVRPDEVIAAIEADEPLDIQSLVYACDAVGVRLSLAPAFHGRRTSGLQLDRINDIPLLVIHAAPLDYYLNAALKRCVDVIGSAVLLFLLSPLFLIIAIGVKKSSPGPVFFRQIRVGYRREPFVMYKFRSMYENSEENSAWTTADDPRKTRFGAFLRKWSLDELPQLFNVVKGDMSLVGPRPELPVFVEKFRKDVPMYMVKHLVRPGMTGLAQVKGFRGDTSIEKRIEWDIYYVENWTFWMDMKILFQTLAYLKNEEENLVQK